jgi:uncharacterized membrane protein
MRLTKFRPSRRVFALSITLLVGAVLNFGFVMPDSFCLITDEAFSWKVATQSDPTEVIGMTARDVHPPLYYLCLWLWIANLGAAEVRMRALSGLFCMGTALAAYAYTRVWAQSRDAQDTESAALLAGLAVTVSIPQVTIAHVARMYALMSLLALLAAGALLMAIRRPERLRWWIAYAVVASALTYTHNYGLYFVGGQALWLLSEAVRRDRRPEARLILSRGVAAFVLVGLAYLPWLPWLLWQARQVSVLD